MVKVAIVGILVAFVCFYTVTSPDSAATIVHAGWRSAVGIAHGIGQFINKLSS